MPRNAFTLIELLVVIAIIALLVSILVPTLNQAKDLARDVLCVSNLHHIAEAIHMYTIDFDGLFPYNAWGHDNGPEGWTNWWYRVGKVAESHHHWDPNMRDRLDPIWHKGYIEWRRKEYEQGVFKCPTANQQIEPKWLVQDRWDNHYGMNGYLVGDMERQPPWTVQCYNVEDFPSRLHMVSDAHLWWAPTVNGGTGGFYMGDGASLNPWWYAYDAWPLQLFAYDAEPNPFRGHAGRTANVARIDGSVAPERELTWEDFMVR